MATQAETSLQQTVRRLLDHLDAMDLDGLGEMVDDEVQGVDEIARRWMRGRPAIEGYLAQLKDTVSDVRSQMSDAQEEAWGDAGLVTFVLDQSYTLDGQQQTISAPTSIVFRRRGSDWKIVLIHSVPLPEDA
ncbi:MAG TPA: nuclear transport factor 2 family protein [Solirubrobacteraceae bacterium]|nr:nuclear transport factor 2 family protein [Solirubrobacteraceae bacterium]